MRRTLAQDRRTRFRIDESFPVESFGFVFAGEIIEGTITPGMSFLIPEAGHRWRVVVRSIEHLRLKGGKEKIGLVVENPPTGHLPGLEVGSTPHAPAQLRQNGGGGHGGTGPAARV